MSDEATQLPVRRDAITVNLGTAPLPHKLSAIGATLEAVRLAYRDQMSAKSWAACNRAEQAIAEAILAINDKRLIEG